MFEKRRLKRFAREVYNALPRPNPCFDMRAFPGVNDEEISDFANIYLLPEHLPSAVCAAHCSSVIQRRFGHYPKILLLGEDVTMCLYILTTLGVREQDIRFAKESVKEFYDCNNLGTRLLMIVPLQSALSVKSETLMWNPSLLGTQVFFTVCEDFSEACKTEGFYKALDDSVKAVEQQKKLSRIKFSGDDMQAFRKQFYGEPRRPEREFATLGANYASLYEWKKNGLCVSPETARKQMKKLVKDYLKKMS